MPGATQSNETDMTSISFGPVTQVRRFTEIRLDEFVARVAPIWIAGAFRPPESAGNAAHGA